MAQPKTGIDRLNGKRLAAQAALMVDATERTASPLNMPDEWKPNWRVIPATELQVNDHIVIAYNKKTGQVTKSTKVTKVVHDVRGCRRTHVNTDHISNTQCYDTIAEVMIKC